MINCTGYNVEKDGVYYKRFDEARGPSQGLIKDADPESFVVLDYEYGKDRNHAFYQGSVIPGAEPSSFKPLTRLYA
ncbi:MAG: DKNYY domain-containing protein, partial [Nitrososphaeraceae archaeon]